MALLTITDVITEYGNFYRKEGQGRQSIIDAYYQAPVTHSFFNPVPTEQTQERRTKFLKSRTLQRFQSTFTPIGGSEFKPCTINLAHMKIDESGLLEELEKSWLGFLANVDKNDRKQWPFVRWYMENTLKQAYSDYELLEAYHGEEGTITPGTATAAGESMDGLGVQIADGITAGDITPITGPGAWSSDAKDFVIEIQEWLKTVAGTSNEHRMIVENEIDYLFMSVANRNKYAEGLDALYNTNYSRTGLGLTGVAEKLPIARQNIMVVGLPSMVGSERIFMTPKGNRAAFDKKPTAASVLELENVDRTIKIWGDIWKGLGFWYKPLVFVNQLA